MADSELSLFIERIKTDDALRQKIVYAEKAAARGMDSIQQIAAEAGYNITGAISRPAKSQLTPTAREMENTACFLTCCWVETSVWDTEGPSIGGF